MIRVEFPGGIIGVLGEDGRWAGEGRQPMASLMADELNTMFGPQWGPGDGSYHPDPLLDQAQAAARTWRGQVVADDRPEPEDADPDRIY